MALRRTAGTLWRASSAITFLAATQLPFAFKLLESIFGRRTRSSKPPVEPPQPVLVSNSMWWYQQKNLPEIDSVTHTYFNGNGTVLADSLRNSDGRDALLTASHFRLAILRHHWSGLQITSRNSAADRELSSGTAGIPRRLVRVNDAVVALQRNDQNYFHFITDVLPSLLAWETPALFQSHLVVARTSFTEPLLRLIGFSGPITQIPSPFIAVATNVTVLRLLSAGIYNPKLLQEVARRAKAAVAGHSSAARNVVFLSRSTKANRRLTNEPQVIATIKEFFPDVDAFFPGEVSVEEQVSRMANARIVIATHGAGAANMLWATSMEHFVEISFYSPDTKRCFAALAQAVTGAPTHFVPSRALKPKDHFSDHECCLESLRSTLRDLQFSDGCPST